MRLTTNQDCLTRRQEGGGGMVLVLLRGSSLSRGVVPEQQLGRAPRGARHSFLAPHMCRDILRESVLTSNPYSEALVVSLRLKKNCVRIDDWIPLQGGTIMTPSINRRVNG